MGILVTISFHLALAATGDTYAEAHKITTDTGRPLVVMVGATWCPACQQMKSSVVPEIKRQGILQKVAFAEVDLDEEGALGAELTRGGPIPQIVMYRKTPLGWRFARLIGRQEVSAVEKFIAEALADDPAATPDPRSPDGNSNRRQPAKVATVPAKSATQAKGKTVQ
jgi:thioredoxin-like negative regulator of GroEL